MKRKTVNILISILIIVVILGLIAFYLYDVLWLKTPFQQNLFRTLAIVFMLLGTLVRVFNGGRRNSLNVYEKAYADIIGYAFNNKTLLRKKLLCACRLYNESNYSKALKYLVELLPECEHNRDRVPVLFFIALCYEDAGANEDAIKVYYDLLSIDADNTHAHSNLGRLMIEVGDFETAVGHYNKAVELDPNNYSAYVNRANYYFKVQDFENAIADAQKALSIKNNGSEAASLLTIIYALQNDEENKKKYYHISITSGKSPEDMNAAIEYFLNEQKITAENNA